MNRFSTTHLSKNWRLPRRKLDKPQQFILGILLWPLLTSVYSFASTDFSGTWIPARELNAQWSTEELALTDSANKALQNFEPARSDSTKFCMPFGTPRNTLNTAPDPVEILQRPEQITFVFDRLGDVRRIKLDGRPHPDDPIPSWMGHSVGHWNNDSLIVNTIAMTEESILTDFGLPHGNQLILDEGMRLLKKNGEELLQIEMTLTDSEFFRKPLRLVRYFRRAPQARMSEGSAVCLLDQWRTRLETINHELYQESTSPSDQEGDEQ